MGDLTRDAALTAIDKRRTEVKPLEVPEWGGTVYIRRLLVEDVTAVERASNGDGGRGIAKNLELGVCDANGEPLFIKGDSPRLGKADLEVAARISKEINRYSGLTDEAVEEVAEDFGEAPSPSEPTE